jgi:hypothetical protein
MRLAMEIIAAGSGIPARPGRLAASSINAPPIMFGENPRAKAVVSLRQGGRRLQSPKCSPRLLERSCIALGAACATLVMAMSAVAAPAGATRVAAVFPPWWSSAQAADAAAAAGDIAGAGAHPSILIVSSATPGLSERLRDAGAMILLSPGLAGLCDVKVPGDRA